MGFWHCSCSWSKVPCRSSSHLSLAQFYLCMHDRNRPLKLQVAMYMVQFSVNMWLIGLHPQHVLTGMAEIQTFQRSFFNMSKGCDDVIMAGCFARRTAKGVSRSWWWRHVGLHFDAFCVSCEMLLFCFIQRPKDRVHTFRKYEKVLSRRTCNLQRA